MSLDVEELDPQLKHQPSLACGPLLNMKLCPETQRQNPEAGSGSTGSWSPANDTPAFLEQTSQPTSAANSSGPVHLGSIDTSLCISLEGTSHGGLQASLSWQKGLQPRQSTDGVGSERTQHRGKQMPLLLSLQELVEQKAQKAQRNGDLASQRETHSPPLSGRPQGF